MTPLLNSSQVTLPSLFMSISLKTLVHFLMSVSFDFYISSSFCSNISAISCLYFCFSYKENFLKILTSSHSLKWNDRLRKSGSSTALICSLVFSFKSSNLLSFASSFSLKSGLFLTKSSTVMYPRFYVSNASNIFFMLSLVNNFFF